MSELELREASKQYGSFRAARRVTFGVEQGEHFGLLGPSGAGKTTLLRLIAGLEKLDDGEIVLDSRTLSDRRLTVAPEKRGIGMVFQTLGLWPRLTAAEHLDLVLRRAMRGRAAREQRVGQLLEIARLASKAANRPGELSGGERQRLALVRALATRPRLALLDEPFAHVDAPMRDALAGETLEMLRASEASSIMVSHDGAHLMAVCDRIAVMNEGRIEQIGRPRDIYERPATPAAARMTGPAFLVGGARRGAAAETQVGVLATLGAAHDAERGWVCLRPESFAISGADDGGAAKEAIVRRREFIAGRWRAHFSIGGEMFWTWRDGEPELGAIRVRVAPGAWIEG